jgi:hypothetical protein
VNKVLRTSAFIASAASLALTTGTLATTALANAPDRTEPTFIGELTGLHEGLGVDSIFSEVVPVMVGKLNVDTGHAMLRPAGKAAIPGTLARRPVTRMASAYDPRVGNNADRN